MVVAGDDGNFHFFDKAGTELLVVPTGHEAPITALAHDFTDGTPYAAPTRAASPWPSQHHSTPLRV